jgi:hypothetical protein
MHLHRLSGSLTRSAWLRRTGILFSFATVRKTPFCAVFKKRSILQTSSGQTYVGKVEEVKVVLAEIFCGYDYFKSLFFKFSPYCIIEMNADGTIGKVNPDYFPGMLFKRLVGRAVLDATVIPGAAFEYDRKLRAYAFCGRDGSSTTTILINLADSDMNVTVASGTAEQGRKIWLLTAGDELGLHSRHIRVNGRLMPDDGRAPTEAELAGHELPAADSTVVMPGMSAAFVVDARAGPCV